MKHTCIIKGVVWFKHRGNNKTEERKYNKQNLFYFLENQVISSSPE